MSEAKRTIIVHAWENEKEPCGVEFQLSGYGVKKDEIKCTKDDPKCPMKKSDRHIVKFELATRSPLDLRFPANPKRAMWVSADGGPCPKEECHQDDVVRAISVSEDGQELTVENLNPVEARHKFALNFVGPNDPDGQLVCSFDPIWGNGNGGRTDS